MTAAFRVNNYAKITSFSKMSLDVIAKRWLMCGCANERPSFPIKRTLNMKKTVKTNAVGEDLVIVKKKERLSCGGVWVTGSLSGHYFDALIFQEHAEHPDFELGTSRISKLWIKRIKDQKTMVSFDRGWDTRPKTKLAGEIMDFLMANLADRVYNT
jgi:hypothetical protein